VLLGERQDPDPRSPAPRMDPHMIETPNVRSGLPGPDADVLADPIHGHEYYIPFRDSLQYACVFPLSSPRDCAVEAGKPCDCTTQAVSDRNPVCQDPVTSSYGTTQYWGKAYPGLRELRVLRGLGSNAAVASICPKILEPTSPDFGYNPAVDAIVDLLRWEGEVSCPEVRIATDGNHARCTLYTASRDLDCTLPGLRPVDSDRIDCLSSELQARGYEGDQLVTCEVLHAEGSALTACLEDPSDYPIDPATGSEANGYCYIDTALGLGNPELAWPCNVRFRSLGTARINHAAMLLSCEWIE
jgi:hypothetical protein